MGYDGGGNGRWACLLGCKLLQKKKREGENGREKEGNNGKGNGSIWQTTIGLKHTTNAPKRDWNRIAMIERQQ